MMRPLAIALALRLPAHAESAQCVADLNGDRKVSGADIGILLGEWGTAGGTTRADIDGNGTVSGSDLGAMLGAWGDCPVTVPSWATLIEVRPDPAVVTNPELRAAIEATGLAWRVRDTGTRIEMLLIPPGTFQMGCSPCCVVSCSPDELPVHSVSLMGAFYVGRFEVTQAEWTGVMGSNPSMFSTPSLQVSIEDVPNRPVETVRWSNIQQFLGMTALRLPSEAEWEWAYRAGTSTAFHGFAGYVLGTSSSSLIGLAAWMSFNAGWETHPVGRKLANGFGLHDMSGNVSEVLNDWYSATYYSESPGTNPAGPASGAFHVLRGGNSWDQPEFLRSSYRSRFSEAQATGGVGFRVARNP
jgi:formylglycine-generating enzyme required for sulfatase activity